MTTMPCPASLKYWTLDEVAEALDDVTQESSLELWAVVAAIEATSANNDAAGEWPEPDSIDRRAYLLPKSWARLSASTQANIVAAAAMAVRS